MIRSEIESALNGRLVSLGLGVSLVFENLEYDGDKPYISVQNVVVSVSNTDVTATKELLVGRYILTLVDTPGSGNQVSDTLGAPIKSGFPAGLTLTSASGKLTIMKPPEIREGFREDADWRVPVIINYQAY